MRRLGLFDDDGGLTPRGNKWRVDGTYAEACQEIIEEIYPDELSSLTDDSGAPDRVRLKTWFEHKGLGGSNARQMAATYAMIAEKRLEDVASTASNNSSPQSKKVRGTKSSSTKRFSNDSGGATAGESSSRDDAVSLPDQPVRPGAPGIHLDIQIHIPASATLEQIDQIFASMGKHLR